MGEMDDKILNLALGVSTRRLERLFKEASEKGQWLWPDEAFKQLSAFHLSWMGRQEGGTVQVKKEVALEVPQVDFIALSRDLHHLAVDLFYRTYFQQSGAPRIADENLDYILKLHEQGMSYPQIALEMEPNLSMPLEIKQAADKYRKRIKNALKRRSS